MDREQDDYKVRRGAREELYAFVAAWRPRLKRMGLSLDVQQSDLLAEASEVIFNHARRASALSLAVAREGVFTGCVSREGTNQAEGFFARIDAKSLDEFLVLARRMWR